VSAQDPFETGFAGWRIAKALHAKLHLQIHTDFLSPHFTYTTLNIVRRALARLLLPKADCVRVVSKRIKSSLKRAGYKLKREPVVLPIFVDIEKLRAGKAQFDLNRRYPQFDRIVLVVSRLEREKNIALGIKAFSAVCKQFPKAGLVIVGEGRERSYLEALSERLNLSHQIIFEGWQEDTFSYYKTADVVLNPSLYEGYGLTALEALACGTPVLSTDVGAAREMGATISDPEEFAGALNSILNEPRRAELKHHPYESVKDYLALYQKALKDCYIS